MSLQTPSSKDEFQSILKSNSGKRVVVDFYATWCGPCKMIAPKFKQMCEENADTVVGVKVDVDELEDVAQEAGVRAMPTFHLYVDGQKKKEVVGASEDKLKDLFTGSY